MIKIICSFFGHAWSVYKNHESCVCTRCGDLHFHENDGTGVCKFCKAKKCRRCKFSECNECHGEGSIAAPDESSHHGGGSGQYGFFGPCDEDTILITCSSCNGKKKIFVSCAECNGLGWISPEEKVAL